MTLSQEMELRYNKIRSQKLVKIEDLDITQSNKEAIKRFLGIYLKDVRKLNPVTIDRYYYCIRKLLLYFDSQLDFNKATREYLQEVMSKVNDSELAPETKRKIAEYTKVFWKFLKNDDDPRHYPSEVSWINTTSKETTKITPADLITYPEMQRIVENGRSTRDKALLAVLGLDDFGLRVTEIVKMKVRDVQLAESQITVIDSKKHKPKVLPIRASKPYLIALLENFKGCDPEDPLWCSERWRTERHAIDGAEVNKILRRATKAAGINKKVWVHLLKLSNATRCAPKYSTPVMNVLFGWTQGNTKMHATYIHLNGQMVSDAVDKANGFESAKKDITQYIKKCGNCSTDNPNTYSFCKSCGYDLTKPKTNYQQDRDNIRELISEQLKDPKLLEEVIHSYLMQERSKKSNNIK